MFSRVFWLLSLLVLTACGAAEPKWAPDDEVARAHYVHGAPYTLTLFTVIGNRSGGGAHSSLLVNAPSERAIFDPAGTFYHPHLPERNDVHYGMSDAAVAFYIDYHARVTYHVVEQTIVVSPEVAQLALSKIQAHGAVAKAHCTDSISGILSDLPGFAGAPNTMFPKKLMTWFGTFEGVSEKKHYDDSPDENGRLIEAPPLLLRHRQGA
ncbi:MULTISPECIES: hypothetical protein [Roseobacteraceae]|jgi:hypothetical protein|uniref:Lipoprotein n=1 Tax=Celeribacter baekdonensis B30 TaxID=1208323 RepID=K2J756_9RHOB|nr:MULTISPECIES: hypothetical protein [Roseobacteraceae]EKE70727.1 lipoprotein [Celeribacter baekdonensis B30]KAB6715937.1 hypothetical protein C8029_12025 [Roseobacter sp. TSBP12]|tara:strand:+ start:1094 stop:1720 length:627 start_codon:yes stop_codon:yes gene_type:complete